MERIRHFISIVAILAAAVATLPVAAAMADGHGATKGNSHSNPDGNGVDKPYSASGAPAESQGSAYFDGNNGCGQDRRFDVASDFQGGFDDNNGHCGPRTKSGEQSGDVEDTDHSSGDVESSEQGQASESASGNASGQANAGAEAGARTAVAGAVSGSAEGEVSARTAVAGSVSGPAAVQTSAETPTAVLGATAGPTSGTAQTAAALPESGGRPGQTDRTWLTLVGAAFAITALGAMAYAVRRRPVGEEGD